MSENYFNIEIIELWFIFPVLENCTKNKLINFLNFKREIAMSPEYSGRLVALAIATWQWQNELVLHPKTQSVFHDVTPFLRFGGVIYALNPKIYSSTVIRKNTWLDYFRTIIRRVAVKSPAIMVYR